MLESSVAIRGNGECQDDKISCHPKLSTASKHRDKEIQSQILRLPCSLLSSFEEQTEGRKYISLFIHNALPTYSQGYYMESSNIFREAVADFC
jgi:hypothetical protein